MEASVDTIELENVVASTSIEQELDLEGVAEDLSDAEYNPDRFPGLIYRLEEPTATALLFRSGNIVCTGAKSPDAVQAAIDHIFTELHQLGIRVPESRDFSIQNMVASADLGSRLNLNAIAIGLGLESVEYEPEQFPGLVYRLDDPNVVMLLFGSGKLVITGATKYETAEQAMEVITMRLSEIDLLE